VQYCVRGQFADQEDSILHDVRAVPPNTPASYPAPGVRGGGQVMSQS
jgi:hypothetical protein